MAIEKIHIEQFLELANHHRVIDVRSPGEYKHAHIPGAYSLPLFTDEERAAVGTAYKQESREKAIKLGLDFFGPKMKRMVEEVEELMGNRQQAITNNSDKNLPIANCLLLYCWRGGMRSAGVAWLMDLYGFKVYTLIGGYKKFRNHALETFKLPLQFKILGGYTGSGKTEVLKELKSNGEAVVDLEEIAKHKGSAFGNIGLPQQPTQEMFENILALELRKSSMVNGQWSMPTPNESKNSTKTKTVADSPLTIHHSPLFIDTDMYVLKVWCEFVFGKCHHFILDQIIERKYDLYLLCNTDLPWVKDELREYPDLETREKLFEIYKDCMINQSTPWALIGGNAEMRLKTAIQAVDGLLNP